MRNASKNCGKENNASRVNKSKSTRIKKGRKTVRYSEILFCVFSIGVVSAVALFALSKLHIYEPTQKVPESAKERSEDINDGKNFDDHLQNTHDSKRNIPLDEIPVEQAIIGMWFPYDELSTNITDFYTPYHDQDYYGITAFVPGPLQIWRDGPFLYYRTEHPGIHYRILVCFRDGEQCNEDHRRHYRNNTIMQQDIRKRDQSLISRKEYFVKMMLCTSS
uniref:Uncharacterized protein n=1 Tax=Caenorhabditis japonica TaxID=281687 RepID=A0A8R1EED7_CAEJA